MKSQSQTEYQVSRDGKVIGSFTAEQLSTLVKQGGLLITDHYWREGWPEAQPLADLFPMKARTSSQKEKMELRHIGIAMVMLLGVGAAGLGFFSITRVKGHSSAIEPTAGVETSSDPKAAANVPAPSSASAFNTPKAPAINVAPEQPATLAKPVVDDEKKHSDELFEKAIRLSTKEPKDPIESKRIFQQLAEQGHAGAQFLFGLEFFHGDKDHKDNAKAVEWWTKAANQGDDHAQNELGGMYAAGRGVPKDAAKAVEWYRKAAAQGNADAQCSLGDSYAKGDGVVKDPAKAVEWYYKAAIQGDVSAQFNLGFHYDTGEGVPKDATKAVKWYSKAAARGDSSAQLCLGLLYASDESVPRDLVQAYYWCSLARASGHAQGPKAVAIFDQEMSVSQIAEAQQMVREFKPLERIAITDKATPKMIVDSKPAGYGTGFFISPNGYFVTNHHVVEGTFQVCVYLSGGIKAAYVIRRDEANDLALLKVDGTFSALPIASCRAVALGNTVVTVGFPNTTMMGFSPKLAKGDIASLAGMQDDPRYFQISVPVQPGNSGGALVDRAGNVVGVVSAKLSARAALATTGMLPENVNYAVKSSFLLSFLESVPELAGKLPDPHSGERKFEDVVKDAQQASVLVLVY